MTTVPLPKYTISWDGSAICDPGEILFECLGCDEHQVILDTLEKIFRIETSDRSKSEFSVTLTAKTESGLQTDDFVLNVQVVPNQELSGRSLQVRNFNSFESSEWNVLGRSLVTD